jgi:predicted MFS family arabinose efflux permease
MVQSLMPLWGLNATEAGAMASGLAVGYMLAVPVLTTLTDRIDARFILAAGSALSGPRSAHSPSRKMAISW